MISTADFFKYCQWSGTVTLALAVLTIVALILKWGFKFRLVGATGFMGVLTAGLFALSLVPIVHTNVPGALHYSLIYDNGSDRATIAVKTPISETGLDATLRQAAGDLYSYGRSGASDRPAQGPRADGGSSASWRFRATSIGRSYPLAWRRRR